MRYFVAFPGRRAVPWLTVAALAITMAYADGFLMTALQGAVGAIQRTREPMVSWLRDSTITLPVFVVAVLRALAVAHRRYGPVLRKARTVLAAALLIVVAGSVVGIGEIVASSTYDYYLQSKQLERTDSTHSHQSGAANVSDHSDCAATCQALRSTLAVDERGVEYGSAVVLLTNLVLVGGVVALRGGRLDSAAARRQGPLSVAAATPSTTAAAVEDQHDNDHNYDGNQHGN
ncbi:MAG: hypothetical protein QOF10_2758 [Kribbellaceae bacterium]|nr:hypothetical protein [Kribbellaceae bacterium]